MVLVSKFRPTENINRSGMSPNDDGTGPAHNQKAIYKEICPTSQVVPHDRNVLEVF